MKIERIMPIQPLKIHIKIYNRPSYGKQRKDDKEDSFQNIIKKIRRKEDAK